MLEIVVIRDRDHKRTIVDRTGDNSWFDDKCVLTHVRSREHVECGVVVRRTLIGRSMG